MDKRLVPGKHTTQPRGPIIVKLLTLLVITVSLLACPMVLRGQTAPATATPRQASVQWAGADVTLTGELFLPAARDQLPPRSPAIVLLHGCGGLYTQRRQLTGRHREWAQRFAAWGFVALLVDSFGPRGLGPICTLKDRPIHPWRERTLDAYAALEYLAARADVDRTNIFVMGWSHGGSTVTGVVREQAPGQRGDGPRFKAAIAYYPGCERPLRAQHYRLTVPLLIQHGAADDWVPAAPCVTLAAKLQPLGMSVETILYPEAHHGFDAPNSPLRFRPDVYNPRAPGERGAHVGTHEPARLQAIADTKRFLDQQLAR
jgi:dienelactone hydrolase